MNRAQYLAEKWIETKDDEVLDALARELRPRVERIARKLEFQQEDLVQHALLALPHALEMYSAGRGNRFDTYFYQRSIGRMLNYIRDNQRTIRVSRHAHDFMQKFGKFTTEFMSDNLRLPTKDESAKALGCTPEYIDKQIVQTRQPVALGAQVDGLSESVFGNPENEIVERLANQELVNELVTKVKAGHSLAYLFPGDSAKARRAVVLVRKYLEENS